jgi:hypothetical protein
VFRIGDAFPADDPLARFVVAVAQAVNDNELSNRLLIEAKDYERLYFFALASSHLYEAAETFRQAHREWRDVEAFIATLKPEYQKDFERVSSLAAPSAAWPANRLKSLRNSFFHYLRLDRAAADAGQLPIVEGVRGVAQEEGTLIVEAGGVLTGIRSLFADDVLVSRLAAEYEDGELERLADALPDFQGGVSRFGRAALGKYLGTLPQGVLRDMKAEGSSSGEVA